jgi:hypothetical protein
MQVHVFRGVGRVFAFTESDHPDGLPARYGPWAAFKVVDLERGRAQPGVRVDECLDDIARFAVHITDAHVRITEEAIG